MLAILRVLRVAVVGIGEINTALAVDPKVVRLVELFAVVALGQRAGVRAVGGVGGHALGQALTGVKAAVLGEEQAVGPLGFLGKRREFPVGDRPFVDAVVRDVAEKNVAIGRHGRPFGELETAAKLDRLGSRRNEFRRAAHAWPSDRRREQQTKRMDSIKDFHPRIALRFLPRCGRAPRVS